jgi:cytochrome bd-type quinol oxidase subunit 2
MYTGFKHLHSMLAYVLLAALAYSIIATLIAYSSQKPFTEKNRKTALIGLIATHVMVLIGLVLYFVSPLGFSNLSGEAMSDTLSRLYAVEHPLSMIIAAVLVTVGYSRAKKLTESSKRFSSILLFFTLGLLLILLRIPWQAWPAL